jgi:predicted TIM-barrel fold metal-dependent hydrolase
LCYNPGVLIDSHTHIFSPEVISNRERYLQLDEGFAALYSRPSSRLVTADELVDSMDKNDIDMSLVCGFGWARQELCNEANDYILKCISRYPGRLSGLATLIPESGDSALYELERCVKGGIRGIGEMRPPAASLDTPFDSLWAPIAKFLIERSLICLFHTSEPLGHPYPGKGDLTPQVLYPFITRYPGLKIILAHWGGGMPFYALMPEVKKALANTWFDTAASPFLYDPAIYRQAIDIIGAERILFGSDYPLMTQSRALKEIRALNIPTEDSDHILGLNAQKLLEITSG